jgi:hypothetical protein
MMKQRTKTKRIRNKVKTARKEAGKFNRTIRASTKTKRENYLLC